MTARVTGHETLITSKTLMEYFHDSVDGALSNQSIEAEPDTVYYLVNLLSVFSRSENFYERTADGRQIKPLALMYGDAINQPSAETRCKALRRLGDVSLFISGVFSESLNRKVVDLDYYAAMGEGAYGSLSGQTHGTLLEAPPSDRGTLRAIREIGVLLVVALVSFASEVGAADKIRVGAWNLETLGTPESRDYKKKRNTHGYGVRRRPGGLAQQIRPLDLDVLALIEIDDTEPQDQVRTNRVLDDTFRLLNREVGHDWTYVLFPKYGHYANTQHTGIAWNRAKVRQHDEWYRIRLGARTSRYAEWDRHPHAMKFTRGPGRTDFVVIPIHMKAGRSDKAVDQRRVEAKALVARLARIAIRFGDDDIVLIGDFNMTRSNEPAGKVFRAANFIDLNAADQSTHIARLPLDRIYVPRNSTFQSVGAVVVLAPAPEGAVTFRRHYSDHWPIVFAFEDRGDDD